MQEKRCPLGLGKHDDVCRSLASIQVPVVVVVVELGIVVALASLPSRAMDSPAIPLARKKVLLKPEKAEEANGNVFCSAFPLMTATKTWNDRPFGLQQQTDVTSCIFVSTFCNRCDFRFVHFDAVHASSGFPPPGLVSPSI